MPFFFFLLFGTLQPFWQHQVTQVLAVDDLPTDCAPTLDGRKLLVSHGSGRLTVLDLSGRFQADRELLLRGGPFQIRIHPSGKRAYVSLWAASEVACVDLGDFSLRKRIPVGFGPAFMDFSPDGRRLYVVNQKSFSFSVIDTSSNRTVRNIRLKQTPSGIVAAGTGEEVFVSFREGELTGFRTRDFRVVGSIQAGLAPHTPLLASADGTRIWGLGLENDVLEIDIEAAAVSRRVQVGRGATYLIASPDERFLYVTNTGSGNISLIDLERFEEIRQLRLGSQPMFGAVSAEGDKLFVCDRGSRRIYVIERH